VLQIVEAIAEHALRLDRLSGNCVDLRCVAIISR
jgi:hypothetical protein